MRAGKKPKRYWVKSEIDFLIENRGKYDYNELADMLGRSYAVVYDKMHQLKIDYTKEELEIFDEKHKAQMREKQQRGYSPKDREVTTATLTAVAGAVYHGTKAGKKLDDILIQHAEDTHRSVEAIRKIYEENKGRVELVKRQWESYNAPQDRSINKNRRTGHLTNED